MEIQAQLDGHSAKKVSSTDQVYQSVWEARERGRVATRQTIQAETGLALTIVDDRVKHLKAVGKIQLAGGLAGAYEPTEDRDDDRSPSVTILSNGRIKYELGEHLVEMSRREASNSGALLFGVQMQGGPQASSSHLDAKVREMEIQLAASARRHRELMRIIAKLRRPADLFTKKRP